MLKAKEKLFLMLFKVTRLVLLGFSFFCMPSFAFAQAEDAPLSVPDMAAETKPVVVADINVGDVVSSEADGVVTGSFSLLGNMGLQNRIAVGLIVTDTEGNTLDTETIESNLSLRQGEVKTVPFSYTWPAYLSGPVKLSVVAETTGGLPLGMQTVAEKKLPAVSGNPVRCTVGEKRETYSCVSQKNREVAIEYFSGSVFAAPVRAVEKISLANTGTFVPKLDLSPGRYTVRIKDAETDQALFFQIRALGEYGQIRNVVAYRNENPRIVRLTASVLASPLGGARVFAELRDTQGKVCGSAVSTDDGTVHEVSVATLCPTGMLTMVLKDANGKELDKIEEPFNVLSADATGVQQNETTPSISGEESEVPSFISKTGVPVFVGVILLVVIGLFLYRRHSRPGILVTFFSIGVGMLTHIPQVSALTLNMSTMGGNFEIARECNIGVALDKATYIPGETATITANGMFYRDVDARGVGSCRVGYMQNPTNTTSAFDAEPLTGSQIIIASAPDDSTISGSKSFAIPSYLATGAHSVRWVQANMTGPCNGGCMGSTADNGSIPFSIGAYCDLGCSGSMTWQATGAGPTAGYSCGAGTKLITGGGSWGGGSCGNGTYTRDPGGSFSCVNSTACTACRTNIVLQSNDICSSSCFGNADIYRVQNPTPGAYNQAWWNDSTGISCGATCASYPLSGHTITEINALPVCLTPPPPICVLGAKAWAGLTQPNFWFGGAASGESERIKDSLCPAGQAMTGIREYQYTRDVDEEYAEAQCAAGVSGLGAATRIEAPNAFGYENPGTKTAVCGAGEVAVGVRMYGAYSSVDEEHVDVYCAPLPSATFNTAATHWINGDGSTKFGDFKYNYCPPGEVITGVRWFQWPSNLDEEHTDIQCTPVSLACGATATVVVTPGAVVGVETPSLWQRVWNYLLGRDSVAHASGSASIIVNQDLNVSWTSSGVLSCSISAPGVPGFDPARVVPANTSDGTLLVANTLNPGQNYTFTINCAGATGGASDTATLNVAAATDFKVCPTSATIGTAVSTQLRAFYETVGTVDCGNTAGAIEVTTDPSTNWSSANAGVASVNNAASKGLVTGVSAGTTNISATYLGNSNSSAVTVSCAPSNSCASASSTDTAANTCTGQTFNINDGCGNTIVCNGTRTCDFNWKEVGQ